MTEPRKPRKASWRELPPAEMAAHLLATPTISDGAWTSEPRLPRETRSDFVRRVLLGETPESEPETPGAEAAELAGLKRGCYLLNTDGGNSVDPDSLDPVVARKLQSLDQRLVLRHVVGGRADLLRDLSHGDQTARSQERSNGRATQWVPVDSELVVDQVNGVSAVRQAHLSELHKAASSLVALFKSIRISWVPREMNAEADRLVKDALGALE